MNSGNKERIRKKLELIISEGCEGIDFMEKKTDKGKKRSPKLTSRLCPFPHEVRINRHTWARIMVKCGTHH